MVCVGKVTAMTTSPDGRYCIAAIAEKLHVWQVCLYVCVWRLGCVCGFVLFNCKFSIYWM